MRGRGFFTSIYGQVLVATLIGVALGHYYPAAGTAMKPLGDAFIKLVRMIVGPIIFCTVVAGIAGAGRLPFHRYNAASRAGKRSARLRYLREALTTDARLV